MKTRFYTLIALIAAAVAFTACNEDPLKEIVYSRLTDEVAFASAENAQAACDAMYAPLKSIYREPINWINDVSTDVGHVGQAFEFYNDEQIASGSTLLTYWRNFCQVYSRANIILDEVPAMDASMFAEGAQADIIAQAHFMRAYAYYMLTDAFYQVPLITTTKIDVGAKYNCAPIAKIEALIESDLKEAQNTLPAARARAEAQRPFQTVASAFLARLYMRQAGRMRQAGDGGATAKWQAALVEVNKALGDANYGLMPTVWEVFDPSSEDTRYNREVIWAIRASTTVASGDWDVGLNFTPWGYDMGWDNMHIPLDLYWKMDPADQRRSELIVDRFPNVYNLYVPWGVCGNPVTMSYSIAPQSIQEVGQQREVFTETYRDVLDAYAAEWESGLTPEMRTKAQGQLDESEEANKDLTKWHGKANLLSVVYTKKYKYDNSYRYIYKTENNFCIVRYADLILMKAEILNEINGPTQESVDLVNSIRERAFQNTSHNYSLADAGTKDNFRSLICDERAFEFTQEGMRRPDLIRMGLWKDRVTAYCENQRARGKWRARNAVEDLPDNYYDAEYNAYPKDFTDNDIRRYYRLPVRETDFNPAVMDQNRDFNLQDLDAE